MQMDLLKKYLGDEVTVFEIQVLHPSIKDLVEKEIEGVEWIENI